MKTLFSVVLLIFGTSLCAQQQNTPPGTPGQIKDELIRIEHEIGRANLQCDFRYFERIEAEEFIFTDASGNVSNKRQDLAGEKDCRKSDAKYDIDDTDVRLYPHLRCRHRTCDHYKKRQRRQGDHAEEPFY